MILRHPILIAALAVGTLILAAAPARAEFCGPSSDVAAVEKLTLQTYGKAPNAHQIDDSYVRIVDVAGNFAYSLTDEDAGPIAFYWTKRNDTWTYVPGTRYPAAWPVTVREGFDKVGTGMLSGNTLCTNPNWRSRSSG
jgi:hypothetical protein